MTSRAATTHLAPNVVAGVHVQIAGCHVGDFSRHVLEDIASEARLNIVRITSARRSTADQARIFYSKHVVEGKAAQYKNPEVAEIVAHARDLRAQGQTEAQVRKYLLTSIENVHGGLLSISRHLGTLPFCEIFDVAHYSGPTIGARRTNHMSLQQARAFLDACRRRMGFPIARLGHSAELGFKLPGEFLDEKCFHMEVLEPVFDRLALPEGTSFA